jgi:F0F1-type ATP synthase membrane subunit c/vacuolar-type H+-ATPase subunit K
MFFDDGGAARIGICSERAARGRERRIRDEKNIRNLILAILGDAYFLFFFMANFLLIHA